jgi:flagellar protein FlaG
MLLQVCLKRQKKIQEVHARQAEQERKAEQEEQKEEQITQEDLDELSKSIDMVHSVGLKFSMHNDTGRTMITVTNRDTEEIIREIPSKEVLDMVAKMEEMVGILFDLKA